MASFGKRAIPSVPAPARASAAAYAPKPLFAAAAPATRAAAPPPRVFADQPLLRFPLVTVGLMVLLLAIFVIEINAARRAGSGISLSALIALGASDRALVVGDGEWWRLLTAPLLHANAMHIIGNGIVLVAIGLLLEPLIGACWFAALFATGALGGGLASLLLNPASMPTVGASGAIMAVLAGGFLFGGSARAGDKGGKLQTRALLMILPALIPAAVDGSSGDHVDYAAHLGGLLTGLTMGALLRSAWTPGEARPALGAPFGLFSAGLLTAALFAFALAAQPGHVAATAAKSVLPGLIPEAELPTSDDVTPDRAADLVARYPHDPRAHLLRGMIFISRSHDLADAEEQFREALDPGDLAAASISPDFTKTATLMLAVTLAYEGRPDEARKLATPLCGFASERYSEFVDALKERGICAG